MKRKNLFYIVPAAAMIIALVIVACSRKFDTPGYVTPDITANTTIKALKAMHTAGGYDSIGTDVIIRGIVVGDDKSGNIYKEIFLQDSTGGIEVSLNGSYLYAQYPVGRELYIKCKGLWLSDYGKCIQLGYIDKSVPGNPSSAGIPSTLFDNYLLKGSLGNTVTPRVVSIAQLNKAASTANSNPAFDTLQSTLIQLPTVQFQNPGLTYADTSANKGSVSRTLIDCANNTSVAYTSGYANFAGLLTPSGNGPLTAIYIPYKSTSELIIRDTTDVRLTGAGCTYSLLTVAQLRALYTGTNVVLGNDIVRGVVISDAANGNVSTGNIILQNGTSGIALYFGSSASTSNFSIGDSIEVNITGGTLQSYNGALEVSLNSNALPTKKLATGVQVTPVTLTAAQVNSQIANVEFTLVKIAGATVSSGTYSGNHTLTDATGSLTLYTSSGASFAGNALPTASSNWVGYPIRYGSGIEFQIRNLNDVTTNSSGGGSGIALTTSPVTLNFNDIENGLPQGVSVYLSATSSSLGTAGTFTATKDYWNTTGKGFKNYASATGLSSTSSTTDQDASTNRALGVRQTSSTGYDPGVSFVFQLNNTTGKSNLGMSFLLQSLDATVGRTATWTVDYGIGDNPTSFTSVTTSPATLTTSPTWASTPVTISFPSALNNQSGKVWIRISILSGTTGSSNRPSSAIDDVKFTWQ